MADCLYYQQVKAKHLQPGGITMIIMVLTWKWEAINMDFMVSLTKTRRQHDSILVIVDKITKPTHFILVKST